MTGRAFFRGFLPGVLVVAAVLGATWRLACDTTHAVVVDQVGYAVGERKLAYVFGRTGRFEVVGSDGRIAFTGSPGGARYVPDAGQVFAPADLSALDDPGTYFIRMPGGARSPTFRIARDPHAPVLDATLRALSCQQCGVPVRAGLAQDHPACHLGDGVLWTDPKQRVRATGGWHDAGDYGKYTVNGAYAAGLLLLAAERLREWGSGRAGEWGNGRARKPACASPSVRPLSHSPTLPLPHSPTPPLSHSPTLPLSAAARHELEWLLTMQAPDGEVYHKVTARKHPGVVPAEKDRSTRYLFPPSSTGTADFAAAMAIASRVYRADDPSFADRCLRAAEGAWRWLSAHPEPVLFRNPEGVNTGTYGDKEDADERLWAAVELWRATGEPRYRRAVGELAGRRQPLFTHAGSWADVSNLAMLSLLSDTRLPREDAVRRRAEDELVRFARKLKSRCEQHPLGVVLQPRDYYWGSNGVALNYAMLLLEGGRLANDRETAQAGRDQLHYLLGRNALGISFVTGLGENAVRSPHHAPSMLARGKPPVPGLLVGGPNAREGRSLSQHPATAYADVADNWTVNEPAINLNAELALVLILAGS